MTCMCDELFGLVGMGPETDNAAHQFFKSPPQCRGYGPLAAP